MTYEPVQLAKDTAPKRELYALLMERAHDLVDKVDWSAVASDLQDDIDKRIKDAIQES